jgi:hypothetical protein
MNLATLFNKKLKEWYKSYHYQQFKILLGIKSNPKKETFLELCLGKNFDKYLAIETANTLAKIMNSAVANKETERVEEIQQLLMKVHWISPIRDKNGDFKMTKQQLPIKDFLKRNVKASQLKWRLGLALSSWEKKGGKEEYRKCPCGGKIT